MNIRVFLEDQLARNYYRVKPLLPRRIQILIRRYVAFAKRKMFGEIWPVDPQAEALPEGWAGWPGKKKFAVVLTHDVDTALGVARCRQLMALEQELGFVAAYNFVAEGYDLSPALRQTLVQNGFEVGVHGIVHSREMYESEATFARHAARINSYLKDWNSVGFRSPCVYHNYEWLHGLNIRYDASSFDTDPFEPQSDGLRTIFPVLMRGSTPARDYVELPYTLPQDFSLFILLKEEGIAVWKEKLRWVAEHGGMVLMLTHPDYMCLSGKPRFDEYPVDYYRQFLAHLKSEYKDQYWHALPREVAAFWETHYGRVKIETLTSAAEVAPMTEAVASLRLADACE